MKISVSQYVVSVVSCGVLSVECGREFGFAGVKVLEGVSLPIMRDSE